jgi:hypothetical protein
MQTALREWWPREEQHFAEQGTRARADLLVEGTPHPGVDRDATIVVVEDRRH